ncbi:MAG: potassium-transporting ATPase subunit C [Clostridiales bacterium]|nr:MAG: potassium-transporting ATPase subunit C [Clostridiales bacterium]
MKAIKSIIPRAALIFVIFTVICGVLYTGIVTVFAQFVFPEKANGSIIEINGKKYGSELLGQQYTDKSYMWGRIMNIDVQTYKDEDGNPVMYAYPSNISPASKEYEHLVAKRIEMIKQANPNMDEMTIPVDLVTCSGSGLDPHISPAAAEYQIPRIAEENNLTEEQVSIIVERCTNKKLLGVFGEEAVNVLKVNLILDGILK